MEGFTIIDGVVAVVIVLSALLAYSRGIVREAMAILGWIAAAVLSDTSITKNIASRISTCWRAAGTRVDTPTKPCNLPLPE